MTNYPYPVEWKRQASLSVFYLTESLSAAVIEPGILMMSKSWPMFKGLEQRLAFNSLRQDLSYGLGVFWYRTDPRGVIRPRFTDSGEKRYASVRNEVESEESLVILYASVD